MKIRIRIKKEEELKKKRVKEAAKKEAEKEDVNAPPPKIGREKRKQSVAKKPRRKKFSFKKHLVKAGFEWDEKEVKKKLFNTAVVLSVLFSFFVLASAAKAGKSLKEVVTFLAGYWTTAFFLLVILLALLFAVFLDVRAYKRAREVERVLPDFLQLASANISAGMTIDKALWFAVRPNFGVLSRAMEEVAKATYAGKDLRDALHDFANSFDSALLKRSVSLIVEGINSGGEMASLLNRVAMNIQESQILKKEMAANVTTYVIFIAFAVLIGAPFLFALATQLLIIIKAITGNIGISTVSSGGFFSFKINPDVVKVSHFKLYAQLLLIVTSFFAGSIISVIRKGDVKEGAVFIPLLVIGTLVLYQVFSFVLGLLFSSMI